MKWRALAIILTLASGVAVYAGFYMGVTSLLWTRDSIYRELHFADLEVRFLPDDDRNLPDLSGLEGVTRIERRLVFPGIVRSSGRAPTTVVMTSLERPTPGIHSFKFLAGRPFRPDELDAVVIDASLASYHGCTSQIMLASVIAISARSANVARRSQARRGSSDVTAPSLRLLLRIVHAPRVSQALHEHDPRPGDPNGVPPGRGRLC